MDIIKYAFGLGIFLSPLLAYLLVRMTDWSRNVKIGVGIIFAIVISAICYVVVVIMAFESHY